jgi:hypothetical protein
MSRFLVAVAAGCFSIGAAMAAAALAQDRQSTGPAPTVHSGTKLSFPANLGGATLARSDTLGTDTAYIYVLPNRLQLVVFVRDIGRRMSAGSDSPQLTGQFTTEVNNAEQQAKQNGFTKFEHPPVPSACTYGSTTFRCIVFNATSGTTRVYSKMMMTGYNGFLLMIRADWTQANQTTLADADAALQAFVPALLH